MVDPSGGAAGAAGEAAADGAGVVVSVTGAAADDALGGSGPTAAPASSVINGIGWAPASVSTPGIASGTGVMAPADASISATSAMTAVAFRAAPSSLVYHF